MTSNTGYIFASLTSDTHSLALVAELKHVYREIPEMETGLAAQHVVAEAIDKEPSRFCSLNELDYHRLEIVTGPSIPASVQSTPYRCNIYMWLWSIGFHRMIVTLCRTCSTSPNTLEILTDFIYYAYIFCTELLEERNP